MALTRFAVVAALGVVVRAQWPGRAFMALKLERWLRGQRESVAMI